MSLFRAEVMAARSARLQGDVMISSSMPAAVIAGFIAAVAAGGLFFIANASYARTEMVAGNVTSLSPLAKVVAPRPGLVTDLLVSEGDVVRAGQPLARIRLEQTSTSGIAPASAGMAALAEQAVLARERLALEPVRIAAERRRLQAQMAGATAQLAEVERQLGLQEEMIASTRVAVDQAETLIAKGFSTRSEIERRRQAWLSAEQGRRQLLQAREGLKAQRATAEAELLRLPVESAGAVAQLKGNVAQLAMASAQQAGEQGYQVTAPIAGRVTAVQTAPGRFADGRVPLMTIVPPGAEMRAELYAPSRAMGFVVPGQDVRLMYDAFPYQRFGSFGGKVEQGSRTVIGPGEIDAPLRIETPVYRVRVKLSEQAVKAYGVTAPLQPGMTLTASIVLERRSFSDWILDPVRAVRNRS